ncbi:MAG: zf-HC2 domain-containing protein [Butyrivibrio sp.]|nr:zf-HC2 domain-containing protein [Muribaculum sp.]MCM1552274.1 zf-HC2 domain-containing protein [Butyrivibrio sp.]
MTCKEFEKLIPDFLERRMNYLTLKKFIEHMETCEECHEELKIQFLVTGVVQHLEEGDAFDLQSELEQRLEDARKKVKLRTVFLYLSAGLETLAIALIVSFVIWALI